MVTSGHTQMPNDEDTPEELERWRLRGERERQQIAEYVDLRAQAVALCVRQGCSPEDAEGIVQGVIHEVQDEAMRMHYGRGVPREEVDEWYRNQIRDLATKP
jgi:hypothetical protein